MARAGHTEADKRDHKLIALIRENDTIALSDLIRLYVISLREVAYGVVRREDLARDVVQDTFVKLWNKRAELNIHGSVAGYLYRAVRHTAINAVKHEHSVQRAQDAIAQSYVADPPMATNDGVSDLNARDLQLVVERTLKAMPPQVREIFLMRRFKEMDLDEIASVLGISFQSVKSQMSRAMRRLSEAIRDWHSN